MFLVVYWYAFLSNPAADGFLQDKYPIDVRGSTEESLSDYYSRHGGPIGYYGTTAPGYPNFITIFGS
jgi:hypothetical protein